MKFLARSLNGQFVSIGNDTASARWYTSSPDVEDVLKTLAVGDEITYAFDVVNGKSVLGFLAKGKVTIPEPWASRIKTAVANKESLIKSGATPKPPYVEKPSAPTATVPTPAEPTVEQKAQVMKEHERQFEPKKFDAETSVRQTCLNVASNMLSGIMSVPGMTKERAVEEIKYIYKEVLDLIKKA